MDWQGIEERLKKRAELSLELVFYDIFFCFSYYACTYKYNVSNTIYYIYFRLQGRVVLLGIYYW